MRTTLVFCIIFFASINAFTQSGPGGVGSSTSNILWVMPENLTGFSDNDKIDQWTDASGNSNHLTQSDDAFKPIYVSSGQNGYPLVRFQTLNNRLIKNSFSSFPTTAATVFVVNSNNSESGDGMLSYAASTSDNEFLLYSSNSLAFYRRNAIASTGIAFNNNAWHVLDLSWQSSDGATKLWKDGAQAYTGTLSSGVNITSNGCLALGAEQDAINGSYADVQTHNGDFLEVILYNIALNTTQRIVVANYLAAKYNLTISNDLFGYQSTHYKDVAGIGRYSATDNHTAAMSAGIVNISGASAMTTDSEYLLMGHDGGSINSWSSAGCPTNINKIARNWRLDETGDVGTIDFTLVTTNLPAHSSGFTKYGLMVDADGDFTSGALIYEMTASGSDYIAQDIAFNDGDFVTIVEIKPTIEFFEITGAEEESVNVSAVIETNYIVATSVTVDYSTSDITATAGSDYTAASGSTATITAGNSSVTISIAVTNDATVENDETFLITLSSPSAGLNLGTDDEFTHSITDNDNTRKVSFSSASSTGSESTTSVNLQLSLSLVDNVNPSTVNYYVSGGTATNGSDYSLSSGTVTFAPGEITQNINVVITNDTKDEFDETIIVSLSSPANCNLQSPVSHSYTITDDDAAPTVYFSTSTASASESAGNQNITLNLSAASAKDITVSYSISGTATQNSDYSITSSPVNIYAGNTTKNIVVSISSDVLIETNETVILTLTGATNATTASPSVHTFTITNDDSYGHTGPGGVGKSDNISLWVKAEDLSGVDGDRISSWADASGNSHNLTQSDNSFRPAYYSNVVNSYPVARFNQVNNRLIHNSFSDFPSQEITTIFVNKSNGESDDGVLSYATGSSNNEYLLFNSANLTLYRGNSTVNSSSFISTNSFNIISSSLIASTGVSTMYLNGTQEMNATIGNTDNIATGGCLAIGAEQDSPDGNYETTQTHNGDYAELILYKFSINTAQRKIIENYLSSKYDITVATDLYAFDADHGTTPYYFHNLAGIGQDNSVNLHDDAKGTSLVRMHTPSAMSDGDFLMWGDDNVDPQSGEFSIPWTATPTGVGNYMKRVWKADKTGDVGSVSVVVDVSDWSFANSGDIVLLIDSDDGDFDDASIVSLTSYSAPYATFTGINFSDGDWFTVGENDGEGGSLPIEFLNFSGQKTDNTILLIWETASELNSEKFEIERSLDLGEWEKIGFINAAGNSTQIMKYSFIDFHPIIGSNYYRLKEVDFDGRVEYSSIFSIEFDRAIQLKIYPNPGRNLLNIESAEEVLFIKFYNISGQELKSVEGLLQKEIEVETTEFSDGVYFIEIETSNGRNRIKWIKRS